VPLAVKKTKQTSPKNIIGRRVREARRKRNPPVSQDALAGKLAVRGVTLDQTAISRIENRDRYVMDYEAAAIARALKVSVGWLYGESASS